MRTEYTTVSQIVQIKLCSDGKLLKGFYVLEMHTFYLPKTIAFDLKQHTHPLCLSTTPPLTEIFDILFFPFLLST